MTLRRVQGWLVLRCGFGRYWHAWSTQPPPPELQALLAAVGQGTPLDLHELGEQQSDGKWPYGGMMRYKRVKMPSYSDAPKAKKYVLWRRGGLS